MPDNVEAALGSGGPVFATDEAAGGEHYPYVKLAFGVDNTQTLVSSTNPLPVEGPDAENAAVSGNPVLVGGRYDATPRTLGDGDAGAVALDADGAVHISDGGNTITVDGTVTANLSSTDNTVLDDIKAATEATQTAVEVIDNAISGTEMQVDVVTSALPSGAATETTVDAIKTAVEGTLTVGSHAVTNAGTFAVQIADTSFAVADGNALGEGVLVQGDDGTDRKNIHVDATTGDVQVDVTNTVTVDGSGVTQPVSGTVTANLSATDNSVLDAIDTNTSDLPNVIGTDGAVGPSSVLSVGGTEAGGTLQEVRVDSDGHLQVDVLSGGGSGTEYTEDAVAAADPVGGVNILVREDSPVTVAADGDNVAQRGTAYGAAYCQIVDSSGNFINSFGGSGGTSATDDAAFTPGAGTGTPIMGLVSVDTVDSGDAGVVAMSTDRRLHVDAQIVGQDADVTIADGGNSITVDGTVTANLSTTDNTVLDNIDTNTTRGSSHYRNIDANAEAAIKGSAGTLHWVHVMNMTAAVAYMHLYDATTASVTPGTTTPNFTFPIPTQGDTNGAGFFARIDQAFDTAITLVVTTTTDGSTGDPGTNGVFVNAGYT